MAHAEASARTVDAAVIAAAAQLGLRSDQVDVEVVEEPVSSTFGYIGSPARVRVTPRTNEAGRGPGPGGRSADPSAGMVPGGPDRLPTGMGTGSAVGGPAPMAAGTEPPGPDRPSAQEPSTAVNVSTGADAATAPDSPSAAPAIPVQASAAADDTGNGQVEADRGLQPADQSASPAEEGTAAPSSAIESATSPTGAPVAGPVAPPAPAPRTAPAAPATSAAAEAADAGDAIAVADAGDFIAVRGTSASPVASPSPIGAGATSPSPPAPLVAAVDAAADAGSGSGAKAGRSPRRTYKDEPIEPQMVEEDTERAGDFLEGLLDALDVDGDITTWIDEVGGHIDLEGADLDVLVGSNGETLDALQELTRLSVLRQSKRRVRLLIDINGFRARQREQLTSMVRATVEQVIRTREDHEFEPMTPAERKVVHDAVAAIDGVMTESLGEEPNRRVVIRPT